MQSIQQVKMIRHDDKGVEAYSLLIDLEPDGIENYVCIRLQVEKSGAPIGERSRNKIEVVVVKQRFSRHRFHWL